jgi:N-acetylglucosamine-6-phosphate deacetylase
MPSLVLQRRSGGVANGFIIAGTILAGGRSFDGWVEVEGDRVVEVGRGSPARRPRHRADVVAPGLCDLQVNGAAGHSVTEGPRALDAIDAALIAAGVTSYLPTVITASEEEATAAVQAAEDRMADPASPVEGVHLEGPFLSPRFHGVHPLDRLAEPAHGVPTYYRSPAIRLVTVAPELRGALNLIRDLRSRGVTVSIGHTGASIEQARAAVQAGATGVTHVFNAMPPFSHRSPGIAGWALTAGRVRVGVIPDGVHVDPMVLSMVARAAGTRAYLVTDATPAAAAPAGTYHMGDIDLHREGGRVLDNRGILAGSMLTLDEGVRRWSQFTGVSLAAAWTAGSERPARLVGLPRGLRPGQPADLVLLDSGATVERVMRGGVWVR